MTAERIEVPNQRLVLLGGPNRTIPSPTTIGAKAAGLARLASSGLPVPPAFALTTKVCADYQRARGRLDPDVGRLLVRGIGYLEQATGRRFGAARRPLLLSVRSGAAVSMPGMLQTILNVGLCDTTLPGLLLSTGDPAFVWDTYRRLLCSYAEIVESQPPGPFEQATSEALARQAAPDPSELDVAARRELVTRLKEVYGRVAGHPFPQDPTQQLLGAIEAVLRSWDSERAVEYRRIQNLSGLAGTAVTVQAMVFGNLGVTSGSGVGFTRNPATGADEPYTDFLLSAQGEDVVGGRASASDLETLLSAVPGLAEELQTVRKRLEAIYRDAQDFEFTVEDAKLWLLQTRAAKRTALAALQIACDLVDEGLIDTTTALDRLSGYDIDQIASTRLVPDAGVDPVGHATPAGGGVASGAIALDVEAAVRTAANGEPVILVREHASTTDIAALAASGGLLTATGARTSHAAVVARQLGIACLVNCTNLTIDLDRRSLRIGTHRLEETDFITLDATTGNIYQGTISASQQRPTELIGRVHKWRRQASLSAQT